METGDHMHFERTHGVRHTARAMLLAATTLGVGVIMSAVAAAPASAQPAEQTYEFNIPAGKLATALGAWAQKVGYQYAWSDPAAQSLQSPGVKGKMTALAALRALTANSGVTFAMTGERTVTISQSVGNDGEKVTSAVRVEGAQGSPYFGGAGVAAGVNGVNGSRDITATEGTGSFTSGALTIGSKVPQALKDVPQSISVLTSERLAQQNVTDFTTAMKQLPGVTLVQGTTSLQNTFYSRGFAITSIQVDGGAPLSTAFGFYPQIDMSIYDHVELLRGADGLFNGYGDPSGTVNLVRKKPLDHQQFTLDAQAGSWSNYRVVADATSPLALDGKLRGRLVMTWQDNHYFYDVAKDNKTLLYGIVELDATPTTLVTAGINYTKQNSVPWQAGLPRYLNGDDLKLPRSTALAFPWNRWNFDTTEIFGGVEQKLGGDWIAKFNLTWNRQSSTQKLGYSRGAVNPTNGLGPTLNASYTDYASDQLSAEAVVSGSFMLLGQRQEITVGINRAKSDAGGQRSYDSLISGTSAAPYQPYPGGPTYFYGSPNGATPPINVLNFNPNNSLYTEPRNSLPTTSYLANGAVTSVAYANLRLTAFDRLHLTTGLRWSRYEATYDYVFLCTKTTGISCSGKQIGDVSFHPDKGNYSGNDISWPPAVTLSFDVTKRLTAYVGYTDIYRSQANWFTADGKPLDPVTGSNWEGGFKWAPHNGKLNLSIAAYRIEQKGFGAQVSLTDLGGGRTCCYVANPNSTYLSQGADLEATGEILPGWQASASYTYNDNKYEGSNFEGQPLVSLAPKSLYKLWMSYDFGAAGHGGTLSGLTISGGVNGQSSGFNTGYTCVNLVDTPDSVTGAQNCKSYSLPDYVPYQFIVPAYAVFSARIDYRLSKIWSLAVNLENILDKTYYQTTGVVESGNWYGAPRSVIATLHAKW